MTPSWVTKTRSLRAYLPAVIMALAAAWLGWLLWNSASQIHHYIQISYGWRIWGALGTMQFSLLLNAYMYTLLLRHTSGISIPFSIVALDYFPAQVAKYLPGKVWGIIYQAERMAKSVRAVHTWQVNIELMVWFMLQVVVVVGGLFAWQWGGAPTLSITLALLWVLMFIVIRSGQTQKVIAWICHRFSRHRPLCASPMTSACTIRFLVALTLESAAYITVWFLLLPAGNGFSQAWLVASAYLLAWVIGVIVLVVPNGIFVREASFVAIGQTLGLPQELLLPYSVYARLFFMAADIAAAAFWRLMAKVL